jgi:hypothetical protein
MAEFKLARGREQRRLASLDHRAQRREFFLLPGKLVTIAAAELGKELRIVAVPFAEFI